VGDINWNEYWTPKLYVDNNVSELKEHIWRIVTWNNEEHAYVYERRRFKGVFLENMELNEFPFDTQVLPLSSSLTFDVTRMQFIKDCIVVTSNSSLNLGAVLDGSKVSKCHLV